LRNYRIEFAENTVLRRQNTALELRGTAASAAELSKAGKNGGNMSLQDLTQVKEGGVCEIVEIRGGRGLSVKLAVMGITLGTKVKKISSQIMKGPVTIQVGNTQLAIGFGMAKKVIVKQK